MTELLERAITAVKKLPSEVHAAIAARLLSEVDDEQVWNIRFTTTIDAQWDFLADKVRRNIAAREVIPLDDVFPIEKRP